MRRLRSALLTFVALGSGACAASGEASGGVVGFTNPSTDPQVGTLRPVALEDPAQVLERGTLLFDMERGLQLGLRKGLPAAGNVGSDILLPLVDIDPGRASGQVSFFRWKHEDVPDASDLDPAKAQRYLLVALMLQPDKVIDVERLQGYVQPKGTEHYRIAGIIAATKKLQEVAPGHRFRLHALIEEVQPEDAKGAKTRYQLRVYALGAEEDDPDYELEVLGPERSKPAQVLSVTEIHAEATRASDWIRTTQGTVTPLTVARVLARGDVDRLAVQTTGGTVTLSTRTGQTVGGAQ